MVSIKGDIPEATENSKGFMSAEDKTKLDNINGGIIQFLEEEEEIIEDGIFLIIPSIVKITVTGNQIILGNYPNNYNSQNFYWIKFKNNSYSGTVDWGDGTSSNVMGTTGRVTHNYTDGLNTHEIIIKNVTELGSYCFANVSNITSVFIPKNVVSLNHNCFDSCIGLTTVNIPTTITELNSEVFKNCTSLTSIKIPNSVTSITESFINCTGLVSISIPNSVTSIDGGFKGCTGLTSVLIPSSVTELVWYAFADCTGLTTVIIPTSVTECYGYCFDGCTSLTNYQLYWIEDIILYDNDNMPINTNTVFTVPKGSKDDYIEAGYTSNKIVERD